MHYAGDETSGSSTGMPSEIWQTEDSSKKMGSHQRVQREEGVEGWKRLWLRKHRVIFRAPQTEEKYEIKGRI